MNNIDRPHLSFSGAGFLGIYHLGVIKAFQDYYPDILNGPVIGNSAGSLAAACLCCSVPFAVSLQESLNMIRFTREHLASTLSRNIQLSNILKDIFRRILPEDAYKQCSNRLYVSLTNWRSHKNELVSNFYSNEDLIDALACSSHLPIFSGFIPHKFRDKYYWDGGISNNCPRLNQHTIGVSPYSSPSIEISPPVERKDAHRIMSAYGVHFYGSLENITRVYRSFFPAHPRRSEEYITSGYNDAVNFMMKEGMITQQVPRIDVVRKRRRSSFIEDKMISSAIGSSLEKLSYIIPLTKIDAQKLENSFNNSSTVTLLLYWLANKTVASIYSLMSGQESGNENNTIIKNLDTISCEDSKDDLEAEEIVPKCKADGTYAIQDLIELIRQYENTNNTK